MAVNLDKTNRWKADVAESVKVYNEWFLASAPKAFREQRVVAVEKVRAALVETNHLTRLDHSTSGIDSVPNHRVYS